MLAFFLISVFAIACLLAACGNHVGRAATYTPEISSLVNPDGIATFGDTDDIEDFFCSYLDPEHCSFLDSKHAAAMQARPPFSIVAERAEIRAALGRNADAAIIFGTLSTLTNKRAYWNAQVSRAWKAGDSARLLEARERLSTLADEWFTAREHGASRNIYPAPHARTGSF